MDDGSFDDIRASGLEQDGESSEEEIEVTAAEVLQKLEESWNNEKFAPELLENKADLVECMVDQIKTMEENLQSVKKRDLVAVIHKLEIGRIRYILNSYLRIRLQKIEKNVIHILEQEASRDADEPSRLSPEELQFAKDYTDNMDGLFKFLCLQHMPPNMQNIDRKKSVPRPNLDSYIFLKVLEDQDQVMVDPEGDAVDLEKGAQHIMRYSAIAPLLTNDSVALL